MKVGDEGDEDDQEDDESKFCDSNSFFKKICNWIDWTKKEPKPKTNPKEDEVDVEEIEIPKIDKNRIRYNKSCPSDINFSVSVMGSSVPLSLSLSPACKFLQMLRPVIIGVGGLSAVFILMGINRRREDD